MSDPIMLVLLITSGTVVWGITNILNKYYLDEKNVHEDVMVVGTMIGAVFVLAPFGRVFFGVFWVTLDNHYG